MKSTRFPGLVLPVVVCFIASLIVHASSILPLSTDQALERSGAVFRGRVLQTESFKDADGLIYTRAYVSVEEAFKGTFPDILQVVHPGGLVGTEEEFFGFSPEFVSGEEYLLFLTRDSAGRLQCLQGRASAIRLSVSGSVGLEEVRALAGGGVISGEDVTDQAGPQGPFPQAITGMLGGVNSRFLQPDRGEPIPYIIDADSLPAGISLTQATNAVRQALDAWAGVTSLRFKLEGIQSFGQGANTITSNDERLRIQLHDNFGSIVGANVLGVGGRNASSSTVGPGWDIGGRVNDAEFRKTSRAYVVLKASHASMQNLATFAEVLCHEIGHALNMAHSSEVFTADPVLFNAIMYYQAHADGRGATLGDYDKPVIQQVYPTNTPPYTFNRMLDVVTGPITPSASGINEVEVRGYDLQNTACTVEITGETGANGTFLVDGPLVRYAPAGWFSDSSRFDPSGGFSFGSVFVRVSDGTNASPWARVRVVSFAEDTHTPPDGIPDSWMLNYFGHTDPRANDSSRATDDADGDTLTNFQEYLAGSHPKEASSAQRITAVSAGSLEFQAKAYELYDILGSTNLTDWARVAVSVVPTNATAAQLTAMPQTNITAVVSDLPGSQPHLFFRIEKVP